MSTSHALLHLGIFFFDTCEYDSPRLYLLGVFVDLKIAFDTVNDVMYLIEHAIVIIDWIISCNCPNYTI